MAEYPYMPFFFDAYMLDCNHLNDAEHGRYLMIMKELWLSPKNKIPNDPNWIARRFRRSVEDAENEIIPILKEFCKTDGNWWWQKRICEEFERAQKKSITNSASAKSRWNKKKDTSERNADAMLSTTTTTYKNKKESYPGDSESVTRENLPQNPEPEKPPPEPQQHDHGIPNKLIDELTARAEMFGATRRTVDRQIASWLKIADGNAGWVENAINIALRTARGDPMAYANKIITSGQCDIIQARERAARETQPQQTLDQAFGQDLTGFTGWHFEDDEPKALEAPHALLN